MSYNITPKKGTENQSLCLLIPVKPSMLQKKILSCIQTTEIFCCNTNIVLLYLVPDACWCMPFNWVGVASVHLCKSFLYCGFVNCILPTIRIWVPLQNSTVGIPTFILHWHSKNIITIWMKIFILGVQINWSACSGIKLIQRLEQLILSLATVNKILL